MSKKPVTTTDTVVTPWPVLPTATDIAVKCSALEKPTKDIEQRFAELLPQGALDEKGNPVLPAITSDAQAAEIADFVTFGRRFLKSVDDRRLEYGRPAREFTADLNREVGLYSTRASLCVDRASRILLKYQTQKRDEAAKREREERERQEREALEAAQKLEQDGNTAGAQRVLEVAASAPRRSEVRATETRGQMTGRKVGVRKTWKGDLVDLKALLQAVIDGKVSADGITVAQSFLNSVAASHAKAETVYGVKCYEHESLA